MKTSAIVFSQSSSKPSSKIAMICRVPLRLLRYATMGLLALCVAQAWAGEKPFDEPPQPLMTVPPVHPDELRKKGIGGMVSIQVTVDEKGEATNVMALKSTQVEFEAPAIEAVSKWKFKPATKAGQPVAVNVVIPVKFVVKFTPPPAPPPGNPS
jgi:protein TonB